MKTIRLPLIISFLIFVSQGLYAQFKSAEELYTTLKSALRNMKFESLEQFFMDKSSLNPLIEMVGRQENLRWVKVSAFPAPHGYTKFGDYWVVFHKFQKLQDTADVVYPIISTGDGIHFLGSSLPEDTFVPYRINHYDFDVSLFPTDRVAEFKTKINFTRTGDDWSLLMRINDAYVIKKASINGEEVEIFVNEPFRSYTLSRDKSQLVQSGSIIYLTSPPENGVLEVEYSTQINEPGADKIASDFALFVSYWYPHIGRSPAKSLTKIHAPKDWEVRANGNLVKEALNETRKTVEFRNDVALCFFHIVAGTYTLAAEIEHEGRFYRAWHRPRVDKNRAEHDVKMARDAVMFFEERFGKFPYNGYEIFDTPDFYGVECYSFTVLTPRITSWATSHEIGHTYFGGLVPNTYIRSIWNESITQYVDSVLFKNNSDRTLESGYGMRNINVALNQSFTAHGQHGLVGYMRGAHTMKMLENEIGLDNMIKCLKTLVQERQGKSTEWIDIEQVFNKTYGESLSWFFDQWVRKSQFPKINIERLFVENAPVSGFNTSVRFSQSFRENPYRLRFEVILTTTSGEYKFPIVMTSSSQQFNFETPERPIKISFNPIGYTLAEMPEARDL